MSFPKLNTQSTTFSQELHEAFKHYGGAILEPDPHLIDFAMLDQLFRGYETFFKGDEKNTFYYDYDVHDGFVPLDLSEKALGHSQRDFKEFFQYFPWGRCPDSLSQVSLNIFKQLNQLASNCIDALITHLPDNAQYTMPLNKMIRGSSSSLLRISNFPSIEGTSIPNNTYRCAEHTDINLISLRPVHTPIDIEYQLPNGQWCIVDSSPQSIFVGVGDMLSTYTQGGYLSAKKRILLPQRPETQSSILSCIFYLHSRSDAQITPQQTASNILHQRLKALGLFKTEPA